MALSTVTTPIINGFRNFLAALPMMFSTGMLSGDLGSFQFGDRADCKHALLERTWRLDCGDIANLLVKPNFVVLLSLFLW